MKKIKVIIFDFGGVILNINYNKTINAFKKLGIVNAEKIYSQKKQSELFNLIETGKISEKEFLLELQKISLNKNTQKIKKAWNAMLLDLPKERLTLLRQLKSSYKLFLLSNTNYLHIKEIKKKLGDNVWSNFSNLFDKMYLSHQLKIRKPEKDIFKLILSEQKLNANEVLFIDDSYQHIKAAKKLKLNTYHLKHEEDIVSLFFDKFQLKLH